MHIVHGDSWMGNILPTPRVVLLCCLVQVGIQTEKGMHINEYVQYTDAKDRTRGGNQRKLNICDIVISYQAVKRNSKALPFSSTTYITDIQFQTRLRQ